MPAAEILIIGLLEQVAGTKRDDLGVLLAQKITRNSAIMFILCFYNVEKKLF